MRITDEIAKANDDRIRRIVREEIALAFGALAREAEHQDVPYETGELESSALGALKRTAEGAADRLTCPHEAYSDFYGVRCNRCGEPEPEAPNPFEGPKTDGKTRQCPVDRECEPLVGWGVFVQHIYEVHTEGDEARRIEITDRLMKRGADHG